MNSVLSDQQRSTRVRTKRRRSLAAIRSAASIGSASAPHSFTNILGSSLGSTTTDSSGAYLFDPNFKTPTIAAKTTTLSEHRREVETYE